jgi:hypothetical protein
MKIWYTYLFSPKTWPTELFQFYPEVGRREFQSVADEQELGILDCGLTFGFFQNTVSSGMYLAIFSTSPPSQSGAGIIVAREEN